MQLVALKSFLDAQIGRIESGDVFECGNPRKCRDMIARRLVAEAGSTYETKVVRAEVQPLPARPFRDSVDPDEESPALVAVRNSLREASDVQPEGDPDNLQRRGRGRYRSK